MRFKLTGEFAVDRAGVAKSTLWRQMLADILDTELVTVNSEERAAYGAALLAATGSGAFPDIPSVSTIIEITERTVPGKSVDTYQEIDPV